MNNWKFYAVFLLIFAGLIWFISDYFTAKTWERELRRDDKQKQASTKKTFVELPPQDFSAFLPNPHLTPGAVLPVTAETVCVKGYAGSVRDVTRPEKRAVYKEYAILSHRRGQYEVDHLVSLELGGSNDIHNLWPQSYSGEWNAHMKDSLEARLHHMVCADEISLEEAQKEIAADWISVYLRLLPKP